MIRIDCARQPAAPIAEETLDPVDSAGWEAVRSLGHRMVDDVVNLHRDIRQAPAWRPVSREARRALEGPLAPEGEEFECVYGTFVEHVLPYNLGNIHPRGWGWVNGTGSTVGALADLLAAGMNPNCAGAVQGAWYVEQQVLTTLKVALGWPSEASGLLTSGGSVANLIGIAAARDDAWPDAELGARGVHHAYQLVAYTSTMAHNSVDRAIRLLGVGTDHLRKVPVDADGRMDLAALHAAVEQDRKANLRPFCVIATAGTVDQGAIDPLDAVADFCLRQDLWLHIDAAFGAAAALSDELRPLVSGIERGDSLAFDLHKWLHVPIEAGCVFVHDAAAHRRPFAAPAAYLMSVSRGITPPGHWMADYGPQLTRGFRALKAWFTLAVFGTAKLGRLVLQNVRQTRELETLIRDHPRLELLASGPLNVLCFRYVGTSMRSECLDRLNQDLLADLQESGIVVTSSTMTTAGFALRTAITNHRTRREDLQTLVETVVACGDRLAPMHGLE